MKRRKLLLIMHHSSLITAFFSLVTCHLSRYISVPASIKKFHTEGIWFNVWTFKVAYH
jgi:hypothetical protein